MIEGCPSARSVSDSLFDRQVERLIELGYHRAMGMAEVDFGDWLEPLYGRLGEIGEAPPDHLPFLIVVPYRMLSVARQMEMLVVAKKRGYASIDCGKLWSLDDLGSSEFPYLVCDVDDGTATVGQTTVDVVTSIRHICRKGLTVEEGIALATHCPNLLPHHALALADTDYQRYVPELWLSSGGPTLGFDFPKSRKEDRGVPSCARRLMLA